MVNKLKENSEKIVKNTDKDNTKNSSKNNDPKIKLNKINMDLFIVEEINVKGLEDQLKQSNKDSKQEKNLELTIKQNIDILQDQLTPDQIKYAEGLKQEPIHQIYDQIKHIYEEIKGTGYLTQQQASQLYTIHKAIEEKTQDIQDGVYNPNEKRKIEVNASLRLVHGILGVYRGPQI